jgi:hypothetical protein
LTPKPVKVFRNQNIDLLAVGKDPDGDPLKYRFKYEKGPWDGWTDGRTRRTSFSTLGTKKLHVEVTDGPYSATAVADVIVENRPPTITLTPSKTTVTRNESVTWTAVGRDPDNDPLKYRWFNGSSGNPPLVNGTTWTTSYSELGRKTLQVGVEDSFGAGQKTSAWVDVIRNLVLYWNQSAAPANVFSINTVGTGDSSVLSVLRKANQQQLSSALKALGRKTSNTSSFVNTWLKRSTTTVGGKAVAGGTPTGSVLLRTWEVVTRSGKARRVSRYSEYRTTVTTTHVDTYRRVTTTVSTAFASGFVMLDQDTGEVLGSYPANQWANMAKGSRQGAGTNAGVVNAKFAANGNSVTSSASTYTKSTSSSRSYTWTHRWNNASGGCPFSPLTISFGDPDKPDFLAGSDAWREDSSRVGVLSAMRKFNMDETGEKMWEWVGPKEGLLVFNPTGDPMLQVSGQHLFGNISFGREWKHGFEPLESLDTNKDGELTGEELEKLWVWRDEDSNAKVGEGELISVGELGITSISVNYDDDGKGGLINKASVTIGEETLTIRDWWSMGGVTTQEYASFIKDILRTPSVYRWESTDRIDPSDTSDSVGVTGAMDSIDPVSPAVSSNYKGIFRFQLYTDENNKPSAIVGYSAPEGSEYLVESEEGRKAVPVLTFMVEGLEDGMFGWAVPLGDSVLLSRMTPVSDGDGNNILLGQSASGETLGMQESAYEQEPLKFSEEFEWKATRVSGPSFEMLLDAFLALESGVWKVEKKTAENEKLKTSEP